MNNVTRHTVLREACPVTYSGSYRVGQNGRSTWASCRCCEYISRM